MQSKFWLWPNLLSLDAPLVALLWQALFIRCFHAHGELLPAILLVSAVWLIYAADRALDAWRGDAPQPRHEFYRRHWRSVLPVWSAVFATAAFLAWRFLPRVPFRHGIALGAAVALYFGAVHAAPAWLRRIWPKESAVAVLFGLGASLAAWSGVRTAWDVLTLLLFGCLCWINCAAIDSWEAGNWERGDRGLARFRPPVSLAAVFVALAAILFLYQQRPVLAGAEAASAFAFVLLDRSRPRFSSDALRVLADAALLSPIVFLPLAGII